MKMVFLLVFQTTYTPFWKMPYSTSGFANADCPQSYFWLLNTLDMARLRPPSFKLEIPGDAEVKRGILAKMSTVKEHRSRQMCRFVNNALLMETLLDLYLNQADPREIVPTPSQNDQHVARGMASQNLIVTCRSSLNQLTRIAHGHSRYCSSPFFIKKETQKIHASIAKLGCRRLGRTQHSFFWKSSPQLPNGNYLVNDKMFYGYMFSGMCPSHYNRFADGAGLGVASQRSQRKFLDMYAPHIEDVYNDDSETALLEEIALYDIAEEPENDGEEWHGIDIQTDARHGWRKNVKDTSVVCIGDRSHKVLRHEYITKEDDHVTQRHEKIGTERIYDYFDQNEVPIRIHTHDHNMSINKMVKVQHKEDGVLNQNDKWHALKNLKRA